MEKKNAKTEKLRIALPAAIFAVGAVFWIVGMLDGEAGAVLRKAIYVCMECIGLG
ncbi:MAG: hypothetical protein K6G56_06940 [Clostridiales bacterium]|nr:hypothetical protein [Clostridiales bacterium]